VPLRTVSRRFGISAPRVAVYAKLPWYWQFAAVLVTMLVVVSLAWATFWLGKTLAFKPFDPNAATRETTEQALKRVMAENEVLRSKLAVLEHRVQMDQSAHAHTNEQLLALTEQNAQIKEELAFFQSLGGAGAVVNVQRFAVTPEDGKGEWRYRLLIVQSKQRSEHFRGRVELVVSVDDNGVKKRHVFPSPEDKLQQPFVLGFKFFQRVEGVFRVPSNVKVQSIEARVFQTGSDTPQTTRFAVLS